MADVKVYHPPGWNGMTIRELLDRVDLDVTKSSTSKEKTDVFRRPEEPSSAYLGPKLWNKSLSLEQCQEDDFFVMNIEEFLEENNLQEDKEKNYKNNVERSPDLQCTSPIELTYSKQSDTAITSRISVTPVTSSRPGVIVPVKDPKSKEKENSPRPSNEYLYAESKRAKLDREREERRKQMESDLQFAPEDLALATVPGADFDPQKRSFEVEELRPQPIIRKRPKLSTPDDNKDDKYWDKRTKNNVAARRSREARRLKENQIALRAAFLEKENNNLKKEVDESRFWNSKIEMEIYILKRKLSNYEKPPHS